MNGYSLLDESMAGVRPGVSNDRLPESETRLRVKALFLMSLALCLSLPTGTAFAASEGGDQKPVLITGATTGIGRATAEYLAGEGYFVYAGARKDADMRALNAIDNIRAVRLDVTKPDEIDAARKLIEAEGRGLWGVVNNAGVATFAPLPVASEEDLRFVYDVNVFGVFRVIKAFAPLVIASKGRIVNVSSIAGVYSAPSAGIYSGSKHAVEAMTDSLAIELEPLGVHVAAVNPGSYPTLGGVKTCQRMIQREDDDWGPFAEHRQWWLEQCEQRLKSKTPPAEEPLLPVAETIGQALFEAKPRRRYLVVPERAQAGETVAQAVLELLSLNIGHRYSYSRDEVVALIDAMWPYVSGEKTWKTVDDQWRLIDAWVEKKPVE